MKSAFIRLLVFTGLFYFQAVFAQSLLVRGAVRSAETTEGIPGVNIYLQNSSVGTTSGEQGWFSLKIPPSAKGAVLVFDHISFDTLHVPVKTALKQHVFNLRPKVIKSAEIRVTAERDPAEILKDLPQSISVFDAKNFNVQGYMDAGDLLQTDQSVQIEEDYNGKKTAAIRAGNPEDVSVLFNGIKLNSAYDNIFDLASLNLDDVEKIEVIKGSNTALYGADAFSGVINVVPRLYKDYSVRFQQKIGTYASGEWNLQLSHNFFNRLNLSAAVKKSGSKRFYADSIGSDAFIKTDAAYYSGSLIYNLSEAGAKSPEKNIALMYFNTKQNFANRYYNEKVSTFNQLLSLRYLGDIAGIDGFNINGSLQWNNNAHDLAAAGGLLARDFKNRVASANLEHHFKRSGFEFLNALQAEHARLDFKNRRIYYNEREGGLAKALFTRRKYGAVSVLKLHIPTETTFYKYTDFDLSYRYDRVFNTYRDISYTQVSAPMPALSDRDWKASVLKFAAYFSGSSKKFSLNGFLNYGKNVKFPSMYQQISSPFASDTDSPEQNPVLERSRSFELGASVFQNVQSDADLIGKKLRVSYFRIYYYNKYRIFYLPEVPVPFYDTVADAEISGVEAKASSQALGGLINYSFGVSRYFISDPSAFPFKSDLKMIGDFMLNYAGFLFQLHWFKESEQSGFVRNLNGTFSETALPGFMNMDVHLKKSMTFGRLKLFSNLSVRNFLEDKTELGGIALRDRRIYITFGVQY